MTRAFVGENPADPLPFLSGVYLVPRDEFEMMEGREGILDCKRRLCDLFLIMEWCRWCKIRVYLYQIKMKMGCMGSDGFFMHPNGIVISPPGLGNLTLTFQNLLKG